MLAVAMRIEKNIVDVFIKLSVEVSFLLNHEISQKTRPKE